MVDQFPTAVFEIQLPWGLEFGVKASKTGYVDTYSFGFDTSEDDLSLSIMSQELWGMAGTLVGIPMEPGKGMVVGRVAFTTDEDDESVGCATVESTPAGSFFYFDPETGMPAPSATAPQTSIETSYFVGINIAPGNTVFSAVTGQGKIGEASYHVFADRVTDRVKIAIAGETNPTPPGCSD